MKKTKGARIRGIASICLGCLLLAGGIGLYGYNRARPSVPQEQVAKQTPVPTAEATPDSQAAAGQQIRLTEQAKLILHIRYTKCGHTIESDISDPELSNLTREELAAMFPDGTVTEFAADGAKINESIEGICSNHYILKYDEATQSFSVYRREETDQDLKLVTSFEGIDMPIVDEALKEGILFDSLEQIESYIEDIDS